MSRLMLVSGMIVVAVAAAVITALTLGSISAQNERTVSDLLNPPVGYVESSDLMVDATNEQLGMLRSGAMLRDEDDGDANIRVTSSDGKLAVVLPEGVSPSEFTDHDVTPDDGWTFVRVIVQQE